MDRQFILKRSPLAILLILAVLLGVPALASGVETEAPVLYLDEDPARSDAVRRLTTPTLYELADGAFVSGAAQLGVDVTGEYRGSWGIPADAERGYAFQITLNDLYWQDGTAVSALDLYRVLEESLRENLWIAGAAEYLDGWEAEAAQVISLEEAGFDSAAAARDAGYHRFYIDLSQFWGLDVQWESVTSRERIRDYAMPGGLLEYYVTPGYLYQQYLADGKDYAHWQSSFLGVTAQRETEMTMEDVGILVTGQRELVLITGTPTTVSVLAERLADLTLSPEDGSGMAYGPYCLTTDSGGEILLEQNPYWNGDAPQYPRILCRTR